MGEIPTPQQKEQPDNPYALDKVFFKDISEEFQEAGDISACPFVFIRDSNGDNIMYDAAIHDFFELLSEISTLSSFFLENEAVFYQDDIFDDLDVQFYEDKESDHFTQKNVPFKLAKFDKVFNYEYLITKILELECTFQSEKTKLCELLLRMSKHISEEKTSISYYDMLTDLMSHRPSLDLKTYKYSNQNLAEILQRVTLKRDQKINDKTELLNMITTIFDNYRNEIDYYKDLYKLVEYVIKGQEKATSKVDSILKTFESFHGKQKQKEDYEHLKPCVPLDRISQLVKSVEDGGRLVQKNFTSPTNIDKITFTSLLFDHHFKNQLEGYLGLPRRNELDFVSVLNDFMNGICSNSKEFMEQTYRSMFLGDACLLAIKIYTSQSLGDDIVPFDGETRLSPENSFSLFNDTMSYFKGLPRSSQMEWFDDNEGFNIVEKESFITIMNKYFTFLFNIDQTLDIKEILNETAYVSTIYKAHRAVISPVFDSFKKNARFEKPEDLIQSPGNLLSQYMDFGDAFVINFDDVKMVLMEDVKKSSNSIKHLGKLKTIHDFLVVYRRHLRLVTQLNCFTDKNIESELVTQMSKIFTNKETAFDHFYKIDVTKVPSMSDHSIRELRNEFKKGESVFKSFLLMYDRPFLEVFTGMMVQNKRDASVDVCKFNKTISDMLGPKFLNRPTSEKLKEEMEREEDIDHYFTENSISHQEDSALPQGSKGGSSGRRMAKKVSKVTIPAKGVLQESICLKIPIASFMREALFYYRRYVNYIGLWLQTTKMVDNMYDRKSFIAFNPSEVINFQKDIELGFSKLSQTVMRILKFKNIKNLEDDFDHIFEPLPLFDEYGSIKSIFTVPLSKNLKDIIETDMKYLLKKEITAKEISFFSELELYSYKKTIIKQAPKYEAVFQPEFEYIKEEDKAANMSILTTASLDSKIPESISDKMKLYLESYFKEIMAHLKKLKNVEINEINKISNASVIEKPSMSRVIGALGKIDFKFKKKMQEFGNLIGFEESNLPEIKASDMKSDINRASRAASYDDYYIPEIQETNLFIYYSQSNKLLTTLSLKLMTASLDSESVNTLELLKTSLPFYTLNNLRLTELEDVLFNRLGTSKASSITATRIDTTPSEVFFQTQEKTIETVQSMTEPNQREGELTKENDPILNNPGLHRPKYEYRRFRNFLYMVKRIELKSRSTVRPVFAFVDEVKQKMTSILEDAKLTKPDTVFNTYLNCLYENEQKGITVALLDSINQLRWLENFTDLIDINMDVIRKDNKIFTLLRATLIGILFPKSSSFQVFFDLFSSTPNLNPEFGSEISSKYFSSKDKDLLRTQLRTQNLNSVIRKNPLLNIFDSVLVNRKLKKPTYENVSFNEFAYQEFDHKWEYLFSQFLSFRSPQRSYLSKKIFSVDLSVERNTSMPEDSILPHNIWIFKVLDCHRLLDLNLKCMLLLESINCMMMNSLFSDVDKDRHSVTLEQKHINGIKTTVTRREIIPSLLPFLSNSMFQNKEDYEFSRLVLRVRALELHFTSHLQGMDLSAERFPDIKMYSSDHTVSSTLDNTLRKNVIIDSVWKDKPLVVPEPKDSQENSKRKNAGDRSQSMQATANYDIDLDITNLTAASAAPGNRYRKEIYNDNKFEILKDMVEKLRRSFFMDDVPQAFSMCYLLLREFSSQCMQEEIVRLKMKRVKISLKTNKSLAKDQLVMGLQSELLDEFFSNSYLVDTGACGENLVMRKSDMNRIMVDWSSKVNKVVQKSLQNREMMYRIKIDDMEMVIENAVANKDLLDFYFRHLLQTFRKIVGSKLVLRNSSFVIDLDTLARYSSYVNLDARISFDKIRSKLESDTRHLLLQKRNTNLKMKQTYEDSIRNLKHHLKSKTEEVRTEMQELMK